MSAWDCLKDSEFNLDAGILLAHACNAAYQDASAISEWALANDFVEAPFFDQSNSQGFWTTSDEVALLAFRGTSNIGQWIRDARFIPTKHDWGLVHRGFKKAFDAVSDRVDEFAAAAVGKSHVWVTGHSLGGAVALLAAAHLKMKGLQPRIHTYGQPRVGLGNFADSFGASLPGRLHRFINQDDIVARLPPGLLYRHVGIVKRIVRPGTLEAFGAAANLTFVDVDVPPMTEEEFVQLQLRLGAAEPEETRALESTSAALEGMDMFSDHGMTEYIRLLEDIRDKGNS